MEGFFKKKETQAVTQPDGKVLSCIACGRFKNCENPKIAPTGNFSKGILNICSHPTEMDDRRGKGYTGRGIRVLRKAYEEVGIDLDEDCLNIYANRCYSENSGTPTEVKICRRNVMKIIQQYKPKVIVLFGDNPLLSVIGGRWQKDLGTIQKWQGWTIPDQELQAWVIPTFCPYRMEQSKNKVESVIWRQDLVKVLEYSAKPLYKHKEPEIIYLQEEELSIFDTITTGTIAFDYETTGIKPYAEGHRIVCASVAVTNDKVYTFMMPTSRKARKPFADLLQRSSVGKIAHNMKFEDTWTNVRLRVPVNNWVYDTMLASHIIDNRVGVTGLKYQTYVQFGVIDYDSEVSPYLRSKEEKDANAINRIDELLEKPGGERLLLKYCALDSIFEMRLANATKTHMKGTIGESPISPSNSNLPEAYQLFHEGCLALTKAERQGLRIDVEYAKRKSKKLQMQIDRLEEKIKNSTFYRHWQHTARGKVNLNSGTMLGNYLYNIKKIMPAKLTETGKGSTDEEALSMLHIPELDWILERSKLQKIKDTYLSAFVREQVDGVLHPFFNLHIARTYRSSSSNPNFQNIPKRDEVAMKTVRQAIYPRHGYQLLEMDYSGIEVSIAACYHKDPTMIKYITDPTTDMHGDMAAQICMIKDFDKHVKEHKVLRSATKNSFVFPQFYGDYYKNCAVNLCSNWLHLPTNQRWKKTDGILLPEGQTIGEHFICNGIKTYEDFEKHMQEIESHFWGTRFPVYAQWKEDHYAEYLKKGYITLKTGFVCKGVMRKNEVINFPVQGAAFHCLLWLFKELDKAFLKNGLRTRLVGQIHDAVVLDVHPEELLVVYDLIQDIGIRELSEHFSWINVPLQIEAELCPVDGSWAEKEEWHPYKK